MKKCTASQDGICRNAYAFGIRCSGYSDGCSLRRHFVRMEWYIRRIAGYAGKALALDTGSGSRKEA